MISVVIPVYKNSETVGPLLERLVELSHGLGGELEVVFVVDGSPDDSFLKLAQALPQSGLRAQLALLSRNFGAFSAIRAGLELARGDRFGVLAADLQEPPSLIIEFDRHLRSGEADVAVGQRVSRKDPWLSRVTSETFWWCYRRWVQPEIPPGGVDVFGCTRQVRDEILRLTESNTSLVGLLFWVGFRRVTCPYDRQARVAGVSSWTFSKKLQYLTDSVFNFTDLPVRILMRLGALGTLGSIIGATVVLAAKLSGQIPIPGYTATILVVVFFGGLNCLGLGIIGGYVWRTLENTRRRPNYVIAQSQSYGRLAEDRGIADPSHTQKEP